jgi:hypothetical protein
MSSTNIYIQYADVNVLSIIIFFLHLWNNLEMFLPCYTYAKTEPYCIVPIAIDGTLRQIGKGIDQ